MITERRMTTQRPKEENKESEITFATNQTF
jgi:hypothetical protein